MSDLKTLQELKDFDKVRPDGKTYWVDVKDYVNRGKLREEANKWIKELNKTLEKACKKQTDGYYNDAELEIEGVTYTACAFGDDETQAIIKFINQFFNLEGETDDDGIADVED